jgi:integrase/recombinase XerD
MEAYVNAFQASLETKPTYSRSTRLAYASDLHGFINFLQQSLNHSPNLSDITTQNIAKYLDAEYLLGRRHSTLVRRLATLRQFIQFLHNQGVLHENFLLQDTYIKDRVLAKIPQNNNTKCLSPNQISQIESTIKSSNRSRARRDHAIFSILLESGISVEELVEINLTDLDLRAGLLYIIRSSNKELWLPLGQSVPIIKRYLCEGRSDLSPQPNEAALFISQLGGRMSRQGIWQILKYWGNRTNPPIKISPRIVRHTAAFRLSQAGRPVEEIQTLLDHTNRLSTQALIRRLNDSCNQQINEIKGNNHKDPINSYNHKR